MLRVLFYSPDRHIHYDGSTPDKVGVGGGITSRIRLAAALARLGSYEVTVMGNCGEAGKFDGVHYIPLDATPPHAVDVLIHNTTGGEFDLAQAWELPVEAKHVGLWIGGKPQPSSFDPRRFDLLYSTSNFIRDVVVDDWGLTSAKVMVAYNAFEEELFAPLHFSSAERDPHRLVYLGHPMKGMDAALGVHRILRARSHRFTLHVYGGKALWGQVDDEIPSEEGMVFHGLIGQQALASELQQGSIALHLQSVEEAFGISLAESLRAGCLCYASSVGALPELIRADKNGFLIEGDHRSAHVHKSVAEHIQMMLSQVKRLDQLRMNAQAFPWNWDLMAKVWSGRWAWELGHTSRENAQFNCSYCGGKSLTLSDGEHCLMCGRYSPRFEVNPSSIYGENLHDSNRRSSQ